MELWEYALMAMGMASMVARPPAGSLNVLDDRG